MRTNYLIFLSTLLIVLSACDSEVVEPSNAFDDMSILLLKDGNPRGIWKLNAGTMNVTDSLITPRAPFKIEVMPNGLTFFSQWGYEDNPYRRIVHEIDLETLAVLRTFEPSNYIESLKITSVQNNYHIIMTYSISNNENLGVIDIIDYETLELVHSDTVGYSTRVIGVDSNSSNAYFWYRDKSNKFKGIAEFNTETFEIERFLFNDASILERPMDFSDFAIDPYGRFLYLTVFSWAYGGSFFVIDTETGNVIGEHPCGGYSQIGVAPNGKYVFLSDPAGYLIELTPTNKMWKYDVDTKEYEIFIDGANSIGLNGTVFCTDNIEITHASKVMIVNVAGDITTNYGKYVDLLKLNISSKNVFGYYSMPRDDNGRLTTTIHKIKLIYSK